MNLTIRLDVNFPESVLRALDALVPANNWKPAVPAAPIQSPAVVRPALEQLPSHTQMVPVQQVVPVQQAVPTQTVPTVAPQYTQHQLGVAGTKLSDMGKREELISVLKDEFSAAAITQIKEEDYPRLAARFREMGVQV